ncbi:LamB/YcsF family protein [Vibrio chagasii]|nr:LamB/YcsF family protein [Vibrio chagasii]
MLQHYHTQIGAHPGYQDVVGFGRESIHILWSRSVSSFVIKSTAHYKPLCRYHHTTVGYVKASWCAFITI